MSFARQILQRFTPGKHLEDNAAAISTSRLSRLPKEDSSAMLPGLKAALNYHPMFVHFPIVL